MPQRELTVGLVGAGYIAQWHANVLAQIPGVRLVGVCDPAVTAAQGLAQAHGAQAFDSLDAMMATCGCDAVHILTPPHLHEPLALQALGHGAHVLVEKPFALSVSSARAMVDAARGADRRIAVNHNFLGLPAYRRLRAAMDQGVVGRVDQARIHWHFPLQPLRTGPFGLWMLQSPENLMLELGPHLHAFAYDLFGPLQDMSLRLSRPVTLPTGVELPQGWCVQGRAGGTEITLSASLVEGADDRSLSLRGAAGAARLDFASDTLIIDRANTSDIVLNPLRAEVARAGAHLREGLRNAAVQARSLNRRQPYALGFEGVFAAFYSAISRDEPVPAAFCGESAVAVMQDLEHVTAQLPARPAARPAPAADPSRPEVLVIGGTGFLGRELVAQLAAAGKRVGVLSRARANPFAGLDGQVQMVAASVHDRDALQQAMAGVECVYHLARAEEATWDGYLKNDVGVTENLARAALGAGVKRFVYTGTIASYDASRPERTITEDTDFGDMSRRNLYARSKALCEARLLALHRSDGLPLVIARPGIVVGPGGPLQHWGIGRWHGAGAVRIWGNGRNTLPFVLNEDVARALVLMAQKDGIDGQSFNLVGPPLLSAQDWFDAIAAHTGTRIAVSKGNLVLFWGMDWVKYTLKRYALGRGGLEQPLLADWRSRAHLSPFANSRACQVLGWAPEADRAAFIRKALDPQALFGF
ncbi:NAD-dependent epimerase/dehydratase family protein [Roseinatronobacter alkalisoli]|uniref:NAD-dependent epimerase/dehydratase family protein n=1 Tax=Roseinatronobacter alkalisoli TaxID=3028235 RepID=A0ABT5T8J1_9RHOB|nr:NAD-dependent epimerase/dehydratase family protein [Roseinatronobacter sp. HJB301]MDD7971438.1 NAD-dependent epimerase/dehydratase family protein [Roseinatronobacter sp. HJB301]